LIIPMIVIYLSSVNPGTCRFFPGSLHMMPFFYPLPGGCHIFQVPVTSLL
jgi:hypothetical protein